MFSPKLYISSGHLNVDPDNLSSCILRAKALGFDGLEILGPAITGGNLSDPEAKMAKQICTCIRELGLQTGTSFFLF